MKRGGVPQIIALRALAMVGIFFHHLWKGVYGGAIPSEGGFMKVFAIAFDLGALGVVFFNIMSGFVLGLPFLRGENAADPGYGRFLAKRFRRILPHYYIALLFCTVANLLVFHLTPASAAATMLKHILFVHTFEYEVLSTNIAAYWYMGMLAQFYFLFPPLLYLFRRFGPEAGFILTAAACYGTCIALDFYVSAHPGSSLGMVDFLIYFNIPARLPEFAIGMWMAAAWKPHGPRYMGMPFEPLFARVVVAVLFVAVAGFPYVSLMSSPISFIHTVASCLVVFAAIFAWPATSSIGQMRLVSRLAAASFSIYLIHQPLLSYVDVLIGQRFGLLIRFTLLAVIAGPLAYWAARLLDSLVARISAR